MQQSRGVAMRPKGWELLKLEAGHHKAKARRKIHNVQGTQHKSRRELGEKVQLKEVENP